jgi:D-cysteine desulfhydrase
VSNLGSGTEKIPDSPKERKTHLLLEEDKMATAPHGLQRPWIFELFPGLKQNVPWTPLVNAPTPTEKLEAVSKFLGKEVWIKRDDKTSSIYGGNKPRKLEFILAQALSLGRKALITGGGLGTNHGLATAIFGQEMNLDVMLGLFPQPVTEHVRKNLLLLHAHGAETVYFSSMLTALLYYYVIERIRRRNAYFIPPGGSSPVGTLGYVDAGLELAMQVSRGDVPLPQVIFVAAGTCGTVAGLILGLRLGGIETPVMGVQVAYGMLSNPKTVLNLARKTLRLMRSCDPSVPEVTITVDDIFFDSEHLGGGYGHPTDKGRSALGLMSEMEHIPLDLTYTAKTFGALLKYVETHPVNDPVLFWNTFNSVDLSHKTIGRQYHSLPRQFHRFFECDLIS